MNPQASSIPQASDLALRRLFRSLMLIILLGALDQTIVSVALPRVARELGNASMLAWVISGYLVAATVVTPIYGKLGDLYGRRVLLFAAVGIFLVASVGCALAETMPLLILARVLQGVGGGGLISTAQAIIGEVVPLRERGKYQGYLTIVFALASVGGPVLGGYLTHYLSWRWIFWINLPLGAVAVWSIYRSLSMLPVPGVRRPVDYLGALLLTIGLSGLLIAVTRVGQGIALLAPDNLWLMGISFAVLAVFLRHEQQAPEPILPLSLFRIRAVWIGSAILFNSFFQLVSLSLLMPLGMQTLDGIGADAAALRLIAFSLAVPFGAFMSGRLMSRTGHYRELQLVGTGLLPAAMCVLAWLGPHANFSSSAVLAVAGFAIGLTLPTSLVAAQNSVPHAVIGVVTATTALFRNMGGAIGVAVLSAVLFSLLSQDPSLPVALIMEGAASAEDMALLSRSVGGAGSPGQADFAFQITILVGAAVALAGHGLAWMLPNINLRDKGKIAAGDPESGL